MPTTPVDSTQEFPTVSTPFQHVAVVGAGAVGSYFGARLALAGHRVTLIARPVHAEAIARDGLRLQSAGRTETVSLTASTELAAVKGADLVLFCVKSTDTDATARQLAPLLEHGAVVVSLQNGVENAAMISRHVAQAVVPAVVYVATAMAAPGTVAHFGRGDLVIGPFGERIAPLQAIADFFVAAKVPVKVSPDVMAELWNKLMVNCAFNAISGLAQANYGQLAALPAVRELMDGVVREVVALALAEGVNLPLEAALQAVERIAQAMPGQLSSTAQDMARRKPSEIDHLNGFVARRGVELKVPTPLNQALHALVKLVEATHAAAA
jgi:2-dehydropantoate 2-reductase